MRPLVWGSFGIAFGVLGWFVCVILSVLTLGAFRVAANIFGYFATASVFYAVIGELARRLLKRKK